MERSRVAIIIPAYNEEGTIETVIKSSSNFGDVYVVDDCSKDNTEQVSEKAGATVIKHQNNKGYDEALNSGFEQAKSDGHDYFITIDADGQHSPEMIEKYLNLFDEGHDLILGIRSDLPRISEKAFKTYFKIRYGVNDILCGMKGYSLKTTRLSPKFDNLNSIGTELAMLGLKKHVKFATIPVHTNDRQDQPRLGNTVMANIKIFSALFRVIIKDLSN